MAVVNPLLKRQSVLAAIAETTTGTAESLAGADAAFNVFNASLAEDIGENEREGQGASFGMLPSVPGARMGRLTFQSHLAGNGGAGVPAWASTFLPACGMVLSTATFAFASGSASAVTLTMGLYEDGVVRKIVGAVGTWTMNFVSGQPVLIDWEFVGKLADEADVSLLAPTYPTVIPPRFASATITVGAYTPILSKVLLKANNELTMREDATDITGYRAGVIVDRRPGGSMDPEATLVASQNWMTKLNASTQEALAIDVGASANNTINIDAPKLQVVKKARGNRNKVNTNELDFKLIRSTGIDDELTILFS